MDKNGKIKGKFSIIDLLVIILIVGIIAGIAVRYGAKATTAVRSSAEFECELEVVNVRQYTVDALKKGGVITDKKSEVVIGEIVADKVQEEPAKFVSTKADGQIVESELPERYNCKVTVKVKGKVSDDAYIMDDSNEISVGRNMEIFSKYVKTSGEIKSVKMLSEN